MKGTKRCFGRCSRDEADVGTVPVPRTCSLLSLHRGWDTHRWVQRVLGVTLRLPFVVSHKEASECSPAFMNTWVSEEFCPRSEIEHGLNLCNRGLGESASEKTCQSWAGRAAVAEAIYLQVPRVHR